MHRINKAAAEKLLSIWWFFVIALIGVGIVAGVLIFYSADIDARAIEADILSNRILFCIANHGFLNEQIISSYIYNSCGLKKSFFENNGFLYFRIEVKDGNNVLFDFSSDLKNFENDCKISKGMEEAKYYPRCAEKVEKVNYFDGSIGAIKQVEIRVLAGSNQFGGRNLNADKTAG